MWFESQGYPTFEQPVFSQQPIQSLIYQLIEPMSSLLYPTLPLESDLHQVVESMQSSINPTLPLDSEFPTSHIFFTASS